MNFKPRNGRLLVLPETPPSEKGGFLIPEQAKEKPSTGQVIAMCDTLSGYEAGSKVLFAKGGGFPLTVDGVDYLLVKETEVLGDYGI